MPDYRHNEMLKLLNRLLERSNDGLVPWQVVGDHAFGVQTAEARVVISSRDANDRPPFDLFLYDPEGEDLDSLESAWIDGRPSAWNETMQNLYFKAREIARDLDNVITNFFESINYGRTIDIEPDPNLPGEGISPVEPTP